MSTPPRPDHADGTHSEPRSAPAHRWPLVVGGIGAFLLQFLVFALTVSFGLFWGAWTYLAAVGQALAGFGVIAWLLSRRRLGRALLIPLASAGLTMALLALTNVLWPERLIP